MTIDFNLLKVKPERIADVVTKGVAHPKRGFAMLTFTDVPRQAKYEVFDLRGGIATHRQFANWAKREFGYLRYEVEFG